MTAYDENNPRQETAASPEGGPAPQPEQAAQPNAVPHLTLDPDGENGPAQGDPFHSQEPPRAPEPPRQEAPQYEAPPAYGAPQYGVPQYGQGQYGGYQPPQYGQPVQQPYYPPQYNVPPAGYNQKSRLAAGLLGILLGCLGVHNFYLGFTSRGVVQLVVSIIGGIFTCGLATVAMVVWGFIEGVLLLCASPSRMFDGNGVLLRD